MRGTCEFSRSQQNFRLHLQATFQIIRAEAATIFPKFQFRNAHYWITAILALALLPLLGARHLPFRYDWFFFIPTFWLVLPVESAFYAIILLLFGGSWKSTLLPVLNRMRQQPLTILCILLYFVAILISSSWLKASVVTITTIALLDLFNRVKAGDRMGVVCSVFVAALYLFAGLLLVFSYNDIIITLRFYGQYDPLFNSADQWLLLGHTVAGISHAAARVLPISVFRFLEFVYYSLFPLIGAGVFLTGLNFGRAKALRYIGTILTAYYISLAVFCLCPSQGPQYFSIIHSVELPSILRTHSIQALLLARSQAIWSGARLRNISGDYYIAFPCMHITQSLIVTWFLKPWRRMTLILSLYNILLVISIVLLQWHYIVDILAGIVVAVFAIGIVDPEEFSRMIRSLGELRLQSAQNVVNT